MKYEYFINLDERGEFNADVRDDQGKTVFEIVSYEHMRELMQDGYIANAYDLNSIYDYLLNDIHIIKSDDELYIG